jgi:hypothetical protein
MRLLFLLVFLSTHVVAEVVSWVDNKGRTHYGDRVPDEYRSKSEKVKVQSLNSMPLTETNKRLIKVYGPIRSAPKKNRKKSKIQTASSKPYQQMTCSQKKAAYNKAKACYSICRVSPTRAKTGSPYVLGEILGKGGMDGGCVARQGCQNLPPPNC